jgi:CPA1 family monovalent cation:H+ antiporter
MSLPIILLVVAGLLVVVSLMQRLAARAALPASILFALMGMTIGGAAMLAVRFGTTGVAGDVARAFVDVPTTSETFMFVFVPALLFQAALTIDVNRMIDDAAPILLLAVVAVLVATAAIGLAVAPVAEVPLVACLLLASIVATTDTGAVVGIFRDVGAPARLCRLVEGESLLNDAAAIITFAVLLDMLTGAATAGVGSAALRFLWTFAGGLIVGYLGARVVVGLLPWLQDSRLAQATLTLALPYLVYIIGERGLAVSGVTAAVIAGLVMSATAPARIAPAAWRFLLDLWEQLAYWANSLVFVLAALLVPRLLVDIGWSDVAALGIMIVASLVARAFMLFGFFPILTRAGLSQPIGTRFNIVILWGGLRGAVTLALALAIVENDAVSYEVRRFVAVNATGFVLFTLLVPGLTLRPLIRKLGLDRLSAFDEALRMHVLAMSRSRVAETVQTIGERYGFGAELVGRVVAPYRTQGPAQSGAVSETADAEEHLQLGLVALTQRERAIVLEHFNRRTISGRTVEALVTDAGHLLDRSRTRGPDEYLRTGQQLVGFSRAFRAALLLQRRFRLTGPLVDQLADRFERLLVSRIVLQELAPYIDDTLAPLLRRDAIPALRALLEKRQQMTDAAFEALEAQYPAYAALLEERFLRRVALRREALEYQDLFDERVIGPELHGALQRDLSAARSTVDSRPALDLGLETRALLARVPLLAGLDREHLDAVVRLLRPRFAIPAERLISTGELGDAMYFISSGVVEVLAAGQRVLLTQGDFFGEMALLHDQVRQADVNALSYCQLLVLDRKDFAALLRTSRAIRERIDRAAGERDLMNRDIRQRERNVQGSRANE